MKRWLRSVALAACLAVPFSAAQAHFIFLLTKADPSGPAIHVYFSEEAAPDNPALLDRLAGLEVWQITAGQGAEEGRRRQGDRLPDRQARRCFQGQPSYISKRDLGVMTRGEVSFGLQYYAKTGPSTPNHPAWKIDTSKQLKLDVVPTISDKDVRLKVLLDGKPVEGAEIAADGPMLGIKDLDEAPTASPPSSSADRGSTSFRAKVVDKTPGEKDGKKYPELRHYTTVAFAIPGDAKAALEAGDRGSEAGQGRSQAAGGCPGRGDELSAAPSSTATCTSTAATWPGAHSYSNVDQGRTLLKLPLKGANGPRSSTVRDCRDSPSSPTAASSTASAGSPPRTRRGPDKDLWSQSDVAGYEPSKKDWEILSAAPGSLLVARRRGPRRHALCRRRLAACRQGREQVAPHRLEARPQVVAAGLAADRQAGEGPPGPSPSPPTTASSTPSAECWKRAARRPRPWCTTRRATPVVGRPDPPGRRDEWL